ncbi:MAG: DUF2007 domain-containing protein [Sphingobacteriales bacterium JAD_PAG50586_3]|nr:MAG: DUF2007 domain-containing protein [Sphingobacteriales bacterium JAD_PAG50586_3]
MNTDWVKIYSADSPYKAEIAMGLLAEHGIEAITFNKIDSVYLLGDVEVYVHRDLVALAKHILETTLN